MLRVVVAAGVHATQVKHEVIAGLILPGTDATGVCLDALRGIQMNEQICRGYSRQIAFGFRDEDRYLSRCQYRGIGTDVVDKAAAGLDTRVVVAEEVSDNIIAIENRGLARIDKAQLLDTVDIADHLSAGTVGV